MTIELNKGSKLIALDVGTARIGVAVCDPLWLSVRPETVIERRSRREDFDRLGDLVRKEQVDGIVCGLPLNMDGSEGEQARMTRRWARRLYTALQKILDDDPPPIVFWDERLTTYAAAEIMDGESLSASRPEGTRLWTWYPYDAVRDVGEDAVAAAVILQSYIDARQRDAGSEYGGIG